MIQENSYQNCLRSQDKICVPSLIWITMNILLESWCGAVLLLTTTLQLGVNGGQLVKRQVPPVVSVGPQPLPPRPILPAPPVLPQGGPPQRYNPLNEVPIISYVNENNFDGSYKFSYETGNGIAVQEEGVLINPGQPELEAQTARGSYSYTSPEGQFIQVNWYADGTGFHAEGAHIPKAVGQGAPLVVGGGPLSPQLGPRGPGGLPPLPGPPSPPPFGRK